MNLAIKRVLKELGVKQSMKGYVYLVDAISIALNDDEALHGVIKGLYIDIARAHNVTPSNVDKCIRYCIKVSYANANRKVLLAVFGPVYADRPVSNKQYIAAVADYIKEVN